MASSTLTTVSIQEPGEISIAVSTEIYVPPNPEPGRSTFLLLPFWGGTAETYSSVQRGLLRTCPENVSIAVSYRGTGKAFDRDFVDEDPTRHSIGTLAEDLLRFLQSPQLAAIVDVSSLIICAHSMSAKVALRLATMLPESSHLCLRSLLLLGPAPPLPLVLPPEVRSGQLTAYDSVDNASWTISNVLAGTRLDDRTIAQLVEDCVSISDGAKKGWIEVGMAESMATVLKDASEKLRTIPVRVLAGAQDKVETFEKVESETVATLRAYGFGVLLRKLEDCGHLIPVEKPDVVIGELCSLAQAT